MSHAAQSTPHAWRRLYPFRSHWADASGGRMHYLDEGPTTVGLVDPSDASMVADAPSKTNTALLFVHGNPTWSFHWRRLIAALRSSYRCVAPDHIGCGLSEKPRRYLRLDDHIENLCALVDSLDLGHVTLVAQDWGGAIGLGAMLRTPERLERIVLFNTGAFPPRYIPWRIRACRIPFIGRLAVQGANLFSRAALRMTLARRKALEPTVAAGYLAPYDNWSNRRSVYGFVRDIPRRSPSFQMVAAADSDLAERGVLGKTDATLQMLAAIEVGLPRFADLPVALIWGMRDWCFRPDCLERFIKAWPHADVHRLGDVGHWVVEDAPDESIAIVQNFLATNRHPYPLDKCTRPFRA